MPSEIFSLKPLGERKVGEEKKNRNSKQQVSTGFLSRLCCGDWKALKKKTQFFYFGIENGKYFNGIGMCSFEDCRKSVFCFVDLSFSFFTCTQTRHFCVSKSYGTLMVYDKRRGENAKHELVTLKTNNLRRADNFGNLTKKRSDFRSFL